MELSQYICCINIHMESYTDKNDYFHGGHWTVVFKLHRVNAFLFKFNLCAFLIIWSNNIRILAPQLPGFKMCVLGGRNFSNQRLLNSRYYGFLYYILSGLCCSWWQSIIQCPLYVIYWWAKVSSVKRENSMCKFIWHKIFSDISMNKYDPIFH